MGKKLTWRDVFDCKITYWHIDNILKAASAAGYGYFAWNGRVYEVTTHGDAAPTCQFASSAKCTELLTEELGAGAESKEGVADHPTKTPGMRVMHAWMQRLSDQSARYHSLVLVPEGENPRRDLTGTDWCWVRVPHYDVVEIGLRPQRNDPYGTWTCRVSCLSKVTGETFNWLGAGATLEHAVEDAKKVAEVDLELLGIDPERVVWVQEA